MQIQYCDKCGLRVSEKALSNGEAVRTEDKVFCSTCKPAQAKPAPLAAATAMPSGSLKAQSSAVIRAAASKEASGGQASARISGAQRVATPKRGAAGEEAPKNPAVLYAAVGVPVLLILAFLIFRSGDHGATDAKGAKSSAKTSDEARGKSSVEPVTPQKIDVRPKVEPTPPPSHNVPAKTAEPAGKTQEADPEKLAGDAYDVLARFEGLAADDKAGKLKRIDEYLSKYGDTIVSVRARRMMNELKAPPKPPDPPKKTEVAEAGPVPDSNDASEPSSAGWQTDRGPFDFEDGTQEFQGDGSEMEHGTFKGRKCVKFSPRGHKTECRGYRPGRTAAQNFRIKFRYYAHNLENLEVLFGIPESRPRKNLDGLVQDQWAWATVTAEELKANGEGQHVEFGGRTKGADAFLLIDDVRWEKK